MKIQRSRILLAATAGLLVGAVTARADFLVDATTGDDKDNSLLTLYLDASETTPAPIGTPIWFVADLSGNGVNTAPTFDDLQLILAKTGDDQIIWQDTVAGSLPTTSTFDGYFFRAPLVSVPTAYASATIWVYLWSDTSPGQVDDHFDAQQVTIVNPPPGEIGNPVWLIGTMHADAFTVIPEPSTMVLVGLGILSLLILRRRHTI